MKAREYSILLLALGGSLCAQNVSMTVELLAGTSNSVVNPSYAPPVASNVTAQPGAVAPGLIWHNSAAFGASGCASNLEVDDQVPNQVAPFGFAVDSAAMAVAHPPTGPVSEAASTSMQAVVRVTLHAAQPTRGRLHVVYSGYENDLGGGRIAMDVGADGSVELDVHSQLFSPAWPAGDTDRALVIGAQPVPIEFVLDNWAGASAVNGQMDAHGGGVRFELQFFPDQPVLERFGTFNFHSYIQVDHGLGNVVDLQLYPSGQPGLFAFGTQATSVVWTPQLTQLVVVDTFVVANQLQLAMPLLPPGTEILCQGLTVSPTGSLQATAGLRAFWP